MAYKVIILAFSPDMVDKKKKVSYMILKLHFHTEVSIFACFVKLTTRHRFTFIYKDMETCCPFLPFACGITDLSTHKWQNWQILRQTKGERNQQNLSSKGNITQITSEIQETIREVFTSPINRGIYKILLSI